MSDFAGHVADYLRVRRALGFKLEFPGHVLPQFAAYLDHVGAPALTTELAVAWAGLPQGVQPISLSHRLGAVRGFARYLRTIDPATEVPPQGIWPSTAPRPTPYLWSDTDIAALLDATAQLRPLLRALTHRALFGLLAACGLRIGEALRLARCDVDLDSGVVSIRESKFGRSRLVPLHPSTSKALADYAADRDRLCPKPSCDAFFVAATGSALGYRAVHSVFVRLTTSFGLRSDDVRPRMHDLRHSLAVRTLIDWHEDGTCIDARLPVLSNFLGHANPAGTYWYLAAAPELMELAATRLAARSGALR